MKFGVEQSFKNRKTSQSARKGRPCLNCNKETMDNGSVAFLRGFCSNNCFNEYIKK